MKKKTRVLLIISYALFFALLFFATDIVLAIPFKETDRVREIDSAKYQGLPLDVTAKIESHSEIKDILYTIEVSGYAFIPTGQESKNKAIKLVFISAEDTYEVGSEVLDRFELRDLYKQEGIIGINHGFITRFSPIKMKNGVYKLFIYCYENEDTAGIFDTKLTFEKNNRSLNFDSR